MRLSKITSLVTASAISFSAVNGLNILITNDDGFGSANIRELYKAMKAFGHQCYIVASSSNQSGTGGTAVFTTSVNLTADTQYGIVKKGEPALGSDPFDSHIWYYNGTPATQVVIALDYILPTYANFSVPDLILSGPNFGSNLGPFLYTLAGTLGATYTAVERSVPAIAFSAGYSVQTPYYDVNTTTKAGLPDPATIAGRLAANLAQQLILNANGGRILPLGYGINVNIPYITSFTNASCINPPFIQTRLTGGAVVDGAVRNNVTGLFTWSNVVADGVNACINGDCTLPGETAVLASGCYSSVSVFTTDYDAPSCQGSAPVRTQLSPLVQLFNSTTLVGGLNGTEKTFGVMNGTTTARNSTVSTSSPTAAATATTNPAISAGVANIISAGSVAALMVVVGAILAL